MYTVPGLLISLLVITAASPALWLTRPHRIRFAGWLAALPPLLVTLWLLSMLGTVSHGGIHQETYAWAPALGMEISLRLDGLSLLFGLIISGIGAAVALYTHYYFDKDAAQGRFYGLLFLFMASMLGLVWSDNLLTLFVFWEGTSITSFLLIGFKWKDPAAQKGARTAFVVTGFGALAMLAGFVLLAGSTGTYTISEIVAIPDLGRSPVQILALALILLGAFSKSAQFPFHFWLPNAMTAPTPASAYLHSATMVKAGIYLLARLHPGFSDSPIWFWSLLLVGGITMLVGAISAIRFYDMKALLAYATVSQLGILVMILAFDTEAAYMAAAVGILAHALYKGPLFMVAGIVDHSTGTRNLNQLAGLWRPMPVVSAVALLAGLSMAGLPPFFGFIAKESLLETSHEMATHSSNQVVGWIVTVAVVVAGVFFVAYSLTLMWEAFLRSASDDGTQPAIKHKPSFSFAAGPLALVLIGTIYPFTMSWSHTPLLAAAASAIAGIEIESHLAIWHGFSVVFMLSLIAIAGGGVIFLARNAMRRALDRTPGWLEGLAIFDRIVYGTYDLATATTRFIQGGTLAAQASVVIMLAAIVVGWALLNLDVGNLDMNPALFSPRLVEMIVGATAVIAALTTVRARSRLTGIISIGVVGLAVTLIFIYMSAPDLALTQLLIEVLTVVLMVLVFRRTPAQVLAPYSRLVLTRNLAVSGFAGLLGAALVLLVIGEPLYQSISDYFLLYSVPEGHGTNVVNVILVDFRGFDTLGEITVLAIASLGGYALLRAVRLRSLGYSSAQTGTEEGDDSGEGERQ